MKTGDSNFLPDLSQRKLTGKRDSLTVGKTTTVNYSKKGSYKVK
jgi:hypothetical protein